MLETILLELGETVEGRSQNALVAQVNKALLDRIHAGKDIVLIIDECQNLTFEVLEQVRLLSNLETDKQKLLQIVLIGQPEFKDKLRQDRLRQLRQRVLVHYELNALSRHEMKNYIQHRLTLAGSNGRPRFTPYALRSIFRHSKGIPRIVNNLCDKALLASFVRDSDEVTWWDVRRALKEVATLTD